MPTNFSQGSSRTGPRSSITAPLTLCFRGSASDFRAPQTAVIDIGNHLETKIAAFKAHTSQQPLWGIFEENARKRGAQEMFHLGASVKPGPIKNETDLFDGIDE